MLGVDDVDFDAMVRKVESVVLTWSKEDMTKFLRVTIEKTQGVTGSMIVEPDIDIQGRADFIMKFRRTIDKYSTGYLRAVVDYVLGHPVEFDGYTGSKVQVNRFMRHLDTLEPKEKKEVKYADINPFFDASDEISFEVVDGLE